MGLWHWHRVQYKSSQRSPSPLTAPASVVLVRDQRVKSPLVLGSERPRWRRGLTKRHDRSECACLIHSTNKTWPNKGTEGRHFRHFSRKIRTSLSLDRRTVWERNLYYSCEILQRKWKSTRHMIYSMARYTKQINFIYICVNMVLKITQLFNGL